MLRTNVTSCIVLAVVCLVAGGAGGQTRPGANEGPQPQRWGRFSMQIAADWTPGRVSATQASWTFGDQAGGRFGLFAVMLSRQSATAMALEPGATLTPAGQVTLAGRDATAFDLSFRQPGRRFRVIAASQPEPDGT